MKSLILLSVALIFLSTVDVCHSENNTSTTTQPSCPSKTAIQPCVCTQPSNTSINLDCSDVNSTQQLAEIFKQDFPTKRFTAFVATNATQLTALNMTTNGVSFENIILALLDNLEEISESFLAASRQTLKMFFVRMSPRLTKFPFSYLSSTTDLNNVFIERTNISVVDPFSSSTLKYFTLKNSSYADIQPGTFDNLPNLESLKLPDNQISHLKKGAIRFRAAIDTVDLDTNRIKSFEDGAFYFTQDDKPAPDSVWLDLNWNEITTFEEGTFGPILEVVRAVSLYGNSLTCGCDVKWIQGNTFKLGSLRLCPNRTRIYHQDLSHC